MKREDLSPIFVGRQTELAELTKLWDLSQDDGEHFVYVFFNTPGIGKTTLLDIFGKKIMESNLGLHIPYSCTGEFSTRQELLLSFLERIENAVKRNYSYITDFIEDNEEEFFIEQTKERLHVLYTSIHHNLQEFSVSTGEITNYFRGISNIIPVFLSLDEVQDFEKTVLPVDGSDKDETLFHFLTRIIKALLRSRVLVVLSGTQYHILRRIGSNIGSPIKDKTIAKIISPLDGKDISDYCQKIKKISGIPIPEEIWAFLDQYLRSYSGGHPRTMTKIVDHYFRVCKDERQKQVINTYERFIEVMNKELMGKMIFEILRSDQNRGLEALQSSEQFIQVKEWLVNGIYNKMVVGSLPMTGDKSCDEERERLVFDLVTIGILVQNGNENYYLTSYFHLLLFLRTFTGEHEQFLQEVLQNRFFHLLCGSYSGFGYTFEHIIFSALLVENNRSSMKITLPLDPKKIWMVEKKDNFSIYSDVDLKENILYHLPHAKGIDAVIISRNDLIMIQITTQMSNIESKVRDLKKMVAELGGNTNGLRVIGWFISLFEVKYIPDDCVIVTSGTELEQMLGKTLYKRLIHAKESL